MAEPVRDTDHNDVKPAGAAVSPLHWVARLNRTVPLFYKVLIANAALIAAGALAATLALTRLHGGMTAGYMPAAAVLAVAIGASILVNYLLMRVAFHPLFLLRDTMDAVRWGQLDARAPNRAADPDVANLAATFNMMLDELARHRRSASSVILRALEEERKRIARELHDETSQALTNLVIRLEMLMEAVVDEDEKLIQDLTRLRDMAANALAETRRLTFDLRPTILDDLGLVPAIRWLLKHQLEPYGVTTRLHATGFDERLPDEVETTLFRIVQEALTNVIRHAAASRVDVTFEAGPEGLTAIVVDDGQGFVVRSVRPDDPQGRGLGLFGMYERAGLIGGNLNITSTPGRGTRVHVMIPYSAIKRAAAGERKEAADAGT